MMLHHSFIHSFIPDIYIAPLQQTYSEAQTVCLYDGLLMDCNYTAIL